MRCMETCFFKPVGTTRHVFILSDDDDWHAMLGSGYSHAWQLKYAFN